MKSLTWYHVGVLAVVVAWGVGLGNASASGGGWSSESTRGGAASMQAAPVWQRVAYDPLVQQIQRGLNALGYDAGPEDGVIGQRTRAAIEAYERRHNLLVTGQPSRSLLEHIDARRAERAAPAAPVQQTAQQELIMDIQSQLRVLKYDVQVSGRLDPATQEAIRSYERQHDLLVTGQPSTALLDHLEQRVAVPQRQPSSELVAQIQSALRQRGYDIEAVSGRMDAATEQAIRSYQRRRGLRVTGKPSRRLLTMLEEGQAQDMQLSQREQIQQVQEALNARGYGVGPADGVMGPSTRIAIQTYQSDAGMPVTGQISPGLLASLGISGQATTGMGSTGAPTAPASQPTFRVRVADDFSDGNYTSNPAWTILAGDFRVQNGRLVSTVRTDAQDDAQELGKALLRNVLGSALGVRLPGLGGATAAALQLPIDRVYRISAELSGSGGNGRALVNLGTYQGNDAANGYRLVFDEQTGQQLKLLVSTERGVSTLASTTMMSPLTDGKTHTLVWDRDPAGRMTVSVDDSVVMEASDQTFQRDFDGFSFINGGGTWSLASLTVYAPQTR